jgi:hypothetical protein
MTKICPECRELAERVAGNVRGGYSATIRVDEHEQEFVKDNDGPWVLNTDVADAIRALPAREPVTEWIPVSERLPDRDHNLWLVVVTNKHGYGRVTVEFYHFHEGWATDENVTHWMPIPEPPLKEERGE